MIEREDIGALLAIINIVCRANRWQPEVIVTDSGSVDGTPECVQAAETALTVRCHRATGGKGLAGDVLDAVKLAAGEIVVVMDVDLSHSPEVLPALVEPLRDGCCDMAIGSRYVNGAQISDWPWARRLIGKNLLLVEFARDELHKPSVAEHLRSLGRCGSAS